MKARCGFAFPSGIGGRETEHPPFGEYTAASAEFNPPAKSATVKIILNLPGIYMMNLESILVTESKLMFYGPF